MTWTLYGWYALTATVSAISPGPAVLLVISQALQGGRKRAFWASLGILSVNALYFGLSAVGLGAMLTASHQLFVVVKWIGAAYLVYLGIRTFFGQSTLSISDALPQEAKGGNAGPGKPDSTSPARTWARGAVLQAANPKAVIFFTALLPQFIRAKSSVPQQMVILGATSIVVELFILIIYGALAGRLSVVARQPRFLKTTNRVAGTLLVGAGTGIALVTER
jgi:threonine/homoserine/homoserine lactone efflux protein